ncbi:MAG: hypothetical protein AAF958_19210 [Planctomycetota bacterium]
MNRRTRADYASAVAQVADLESTLEFVVRDSKPKSEHPGPSRFSPHLPDYPQYIFESRTLKIDQLAPGWKPLWGDDFEVRILGDFPTPCRPETDGTADAVVRGDELKFSRYGEHYLHTNLGFFKILLVDPSSDDDQRVIAISRFVAGNTVHSLADEPLLESHPDAWPLTPKRLLPVLFASDQPLKLHCGPVSDFLSWMLDDRGYEIQQVNFRNRDGLGHVAMQVKMSDGGYAYIDPDFGAMVESRDGDRLSIEEIRDALRAGRREDLVVIDIGRKQHLRREYNLIDPSPPFSWSPSKTLDQPYLRRESFLDMIAEYSHRIFIEGMPAIEKDDL